MDQRNARGRRSRTCRRCAVAAHALRSLPPASSLRPSPPRLPRLPPPWPHRRAVSTQGSSERSSATSGCLRPLPLPPPPQQAAGQVLTQSRSGKARDRCCCSGPKASHYSAHPAKIISSSNNYVHSVDGTAALKAKSHRQRGTSIRLRSAACAREAFILSVAILIEDTVVGDCQLAVPGGGQPRATPRHAHLPPLRIFLPCTHLVQRPAESQAAQWAAVQTVHTPCFEAYRGFLAESWGEHRVQWLGTWGLQASQ